MILYIDSFKSDKGEGKYVSTLKQVFRITIDNKQVLIYKVIKFKKVTMYTPYLRLNCSQTSGSFVREQVVFLVIVLKPVPP